MTDNCQIKTTDTFITTPDKKCLRMDFTVVLYFIITFLVLITKNIIIVV